MSRSAVPVPAGRRPAAGVVLFVALLASTFGLTVTSIALFTDQESVDGVFTTGTIVLDAARIDSLSLTAGALMPGDSLTDDVVVENDGTARLRYALSTTSTNADGKALRDALTATVRTIDVTTPGAPCDDFDGIALYGGALGPTAVGFGDPAAGGQSGDRTLDAGASETLCIRVALPSSAGNAYQGATTTTTFVFDAEQTANNP